MSSADVRLVDYNYAFDPSVDLLASSEDVSFPVTNLRKFTRSALWKSSGYFKITDDNNKMNFDEGAAELTATLTNGTYTPDELEVEIKAALEAAGAATFTVSYSIDTGKWTIASNGAELNLLTDTGSNFADATYPTIGFDVSEDYTGALTYTGSNIALHTEEFVVLDLMSANAIDTFAMVLDPLLGNKLTSSAVVKLQGSASNAWVTPGVSVTLSYDEDYQVWTHFFTTANTYRYWRVQIVDPSNPNLSVEIHKVFLGLSLDLERNPSVGFKYSIKNNSDLRSTDYGHKYADIYPDLRAFEFNLNLFSNADFELLEESFKRFGNAAPVLLAIDTTEDLFDKDHLVLYGYLKGDLAFNHSNIDLFSSTLLVEESF